MIIGIIGNGFVGNATKLIKSSTVTKLYVYDIVPEKCEPAGLTFGMLAECDIIFVALPTPMRPDGSCHLDIIEGCINKLKKIIDPKHTSIVLRSTVPPGTSERLGVNFMPEFLTERNWHMDFVTCKHWIFGCDPESNMFKHQIRKLFDTAYNEQILMSNSTHFIGKREAEMIKYVRNCFLALKVSFFNEIDQYNNLMGINSETVRYFSTLDDRIGSSHTKVPGVDGHKGFGGTCFPKDTHAIVNEMEKIGMKSYIIKGAIERNEEVDRPECEWKNDNGRAVV